MLPPGVNFEDLGGVAALVLAGHGCSAANLPTWIANLQPEVILLSAAPGNLGALRSPEDIRAIQGCTLLRTDQNGWIELATDGERMWVEAQRS